MPVLFDAKLTPNERQLSSDWSDLSQHRITIRITDDEFSRLQFSIRRTRQTVSNKVYCILREYIDKQQINESDLKRFLSDDKNKGSDDIFG